MVGTTLNLIAILIGTLVGRLTQTQPPASTQSAFKVLLGAFTVWTGLAAVWASVQGTFLQILGQLGIAVLALMLGHATGRLLQVQRRLNHFGSQARVSFETASRTGQPPPFNTAFLACVVFFAANPLGVFGAVLDGSASNWKPLAIKAAMDGLSALTFARVLGWGVMASVIPVAALQGTLTLATHWASLSLLSQPQSQALGATTGLLVFTVSLIILELKKIQLADYLPSLVYAPLLAWLFRG